MAITPIAGLVSSQVLKIPIADHDDILGSGIQPQSWSTDRIDWRCRYYWYIGRERVVQKKVGS